MKIKILCQPALIVLIISIPILYSCKKPQGNPVSDNQHNDKGLLSVIESYYAFSKTKVDGTFMFESNLTNNDANDKNTAMAVGVFYDKSGNTQTGGGLVSIGNRQLSMNNAGTYGLDKTYSTDEFFGKKIEFTITPPKDNSGSTRGAASATITGSLYSPEAINITNIPARTPVVIQPGTSTPIAWNTDPNNPNGVIIVAEYLPTLYANRPSLSNGYSNFLTNSMLVPDNGTTSLPWSFFSGYPTGSHIILWVARGNYTILNDGSYNYQVGGYTAAAVWDVSVPSSPPAINGGTSYFFSTSQTSGGGKITASPGSTVTVTVSAGGSGSGFYTEFDLSGASFLTNTSSGSPTSLTANNNSNTATFTMPASGSVSWTGLYRAPNSYGSGSISVH